MAMTPAQAARARVVAAADNMNTRQISTKLDEKLGAKDWRRVRAELINEAEAAGPDFKAALLYRGNIPAGAVYTDRLVLIDDENGAPPLGLPQVRQKALMARLRQALPTGGESERIIKECVHAGGRLGDDGAPDGPMQALMLLDMRWAAPAGDDVRRNSEAGACGVTVTSQLSPSLTALTARADSEIPCLVV